MPARIGITALIVTSLLLTPTAAQAAAPEGFALEATDVIAGIESGGTITSVLLTNSSDEAISLPEVTLTADASDLRGKAVLDGGSDCTGDGSTLVCTYPQTTVEAHSYAVLPNLTVRPTSGAQAGDRGTVKLAVGEATATVQVTLAESVSLSTGPEVSAAGEPGSTATFAPSVINTGANPVNGVVFSGGAGSPNVTYDRTFSNCLYADHEFFCTLDEVLAPGRQYETAEGVPMKIRADAPAPLQFRSGVAWQTKTDAAKPLEEFKQRNPVTSAGTGGPLRLVEKPVASRAALSDTQTDPDDFDNYAYVTVDITGENAPDEAAIGASLRGKVGKIAEVNVGLKNLGPARLDTVINSPTIEVVIPSGASVESYDTGSCYLRIADTYRCSFSDVEVGQTVTVPFQLRITSARSSTGSVTIATEFWDGTPGPDQDRSNNTAAIVVNGRR